jgi:hypothetical protein
MRPSPDRPADRKAPRNDSGETSKKPYRPPRLAKYGSLAQLALTKGGVKSDGGSNNSKV